MQKNRIIIVDGYNVIHRVPALRKVLGLSLESAREGLLRYCTAWRSKRRDVSQIYVVFDGDSSVVSVGNWLACGVREIYTRTKEEADDRILDIVKKGRRASEYVVVSDDNYVSRNSRGLNAKVMSVSEFYRAPIGDRQSGRPEPENEAKSPLSPTEEREINENLKKVWGVD